MLDGNSAAELARDTVMPKTKSQIHQRIEQLQEHLEAIELAEQEKQVFILRLKDGSRFKPNTHRSIEYNVGDCFEYLSPEAQAKIPDEIDIEDEYNNGNLQHLEVEIEAAIIKLADWVYEI